MSSTTTTCRQAGSPSQAHGKTTTRAALAGPQRRDLKFRVSCVLIVNATILVILSTAPTRHRAFAAATAAAVAARSRQLAPPAHQDAAATKNRSREVATSERQSERLQQVQLPRLNATGRPHEAQEDASEQSEPAGVRLAAAQASSPPQTDALVYLQRYGYMQAGAQASNNLVSEESFSSAVSEFQQFAGLPPTGQLDNQTLAMMRQPRCGNSDKQRAAATISKSGQLRSFTAALDSGHQRPTVRQKRYALQGSKWRRQELTYRISQYPTKFAGRRHEVDSQIERAFGIWSQVAPIDFVVKREGRVHIDIRFASGDHGDGDAFDGPGNTLAHAYFPQYGGDAHFDDQEYWTVDSYAGTNIFQVAAHELGHSLGLGHSNVREALMAPFYQKYKPNFKLHLDDVLAIQALYGEKALYGGDAPELSPGRRPESSPQTTTSSSTTPAPPTTTSTPSTTTARPAPGRGVPGARLPPVYRGGGGKRPPSHDQDGRDEEPEPGLLGPSAAGGADPDGDSGNPDLSSNGINGFGGTNDDAPPQTGPFSPADSQPADLCQESQIDAITRTEDGSSYVFKGNHYWLLTGEGLARGYPRRISLDWEGLPGHLDAALTWADGKTFFFKGNKYWRFRNRRRDLGYPKLISAGFAGVPDDLDAALVWSGNGRTYFFKGAEYWRFDSKAEPPVSAEYPRPIKVWMGVPAQINAAFKWENNVTYFFKGNQYYRFNDRDFRVESRGRPPFPRQTSEWWFGCVSPNLAAQRVQPPLRNYAGEQLALVAGGLDGRSSRRQASSRSLNQLHRARSLQQNAPNSVASDSQPPDWSLLAGLSDDQTRSMGTHISDHHRPPPPGATRPGGPRELPDREDSSDQTEVEQIAFGPTLAGGPRHSRGPQAGDSSLAEEMTTTSSSKRRVELEEGAAFRRQADSRLGVSVFAANADDPHRHLNSAAASSAAPTSAILRLARDGPLARPPATAGDWLALGCSLAALLTTSLGTLVSHDLRQVIR